MRHTTIVLSVLMAASVSVSALAGDHAHVSSAQGWTPASLSQALQTMPKGNAVHGKQLHGERFCASCHGVAGESVSMNWPSLAGQRAEYTYKMLLDYQSRLRREDDRADLMVVSVHGLSKQDMADLAAYYAAQTLPRASAKADADIEKLVRKGDPERLVTPCAACHGLRGQGGINESPALAGMSSDYFIRTMKAYREGHRHNDSAQAMRAFAKPLTDAEIAALAAYYAEANP
ncbi:MAG: c-type cytochrome [Pseudomonadota bacterium]